MENVAEGFLPYGLGTQPFVSLVNSRKGGAILDFNHYTKKWMYLGPIKAKVLPSGQNKQASKQKTHKALGRDQTF